MVKHKKSLFCNFVKVVFRCKVIACIQFVGTSILDFFIICTCRVVPESPIMVQC